MNRLSPELITEKPKFTESEVSALLRQHYDFETSSIKELDGERDQNFLVQEEKSGSQFVLKIANPGVDLKLLQLQNEMLEFLNCEANRADESTIFRFPETQTDTNRDTIVTYTTEAREYLIRLVNYLPGYPIAMVRPHDEAFLNRFGSCLGHLSSTLQDFENPTANREFDWDLSRAADVTDSILPLLDEQDLQLIEPYLSCHRERVLPNKSGLRKSVIHNDANDYNVIGNWHDHSLSLIDFGDIVWSETVNELAIAGAYVMLSAKRPVESLAILSGAYHRRFELTETETESIFPLACMRLCVSICMSVRQSQQSNDPYLTISSSPARKLLAQLADTHPDLAIAQIRTACGLDYFSNSQRLKSFLASKTFAHVMGESITEDNAEMLDLGVGTSPHQGLSNVSEMREFENSLCKRLKENGKKFAIGRYNEPRFCYLGDQFKGRGPVGMRTVHIGMDVFAPAGTPVYCPLDGVVHSFQNNDLPFDYGPTIILEHSADELEKPFYTLYGHLSRDSLNELAVGNSIEAGEPFAKLGSVEENGNWPAHLHFQIIQTMLNTQGDFPGVANPDLRELWLDLCPDPNLVLKLDSEFLTEGQTEISDSEILNSRRQRISPSLSISYHQPIQMVRGQGAYLIDAEGRSFLDMVNNVCHVGHANPAVVEAVAHQTSILNTNTRYLHRNLTRYAEKLCRTLPDHLEVCFFVNSGSEANDLALRLARNFTGRKDVICLDNAYHGHTASLIDISPYKFNSRGGTGCPPTTRVTSMPDVYRGKFQVKGDLNERHENRDLLADCAQEYLDDFQNLLQKMKAEDQLPAAIIAEPILSCGGQIVPPPGYLSGIFEKTRKAGGVCIADEVQIGFGRVGKSFWGFQLDGAVPDIVTMGKPIANGHPMGAIVTTREIADAFNNGMEYFNTFGGNPVSCAAGLAVLDYVEQNDLMRHAEKIGNHLLNGLRKLAKRCKHIGDVRGTGLFCGIEFVRVGENREPDPIAAKHVVNWLREVQILTSTDGPEENVIKLKPPLAIQASDIGYFLQQFELAIDELTMLR